MPDQVIILSISEKYEKYAKKVLNLLENNEIRALIDNRNETDGEENSGSRNEENFHI